MVDNLVAPKRTVCIILARAESKGIPRKNLRRIGGVSLIGRSVRAGLASQKVSAVYVSTDDPDISREAQRYGARHISRPLDLARDISSSEEGWLHAIPHVLTDYPDLECLVFLQCTSPFTTGDDIDACLNTMEMQNATCAVSVVENHMFLWSEDKNGFGIGQNHKDQEPRKRRQDLSPQYAENGAIYCVDRAAFETHKNRFCGPVALYPVSHPAIEIDHFDDLALCRLIAQARPGLEIPAERLRGIRALAMDFDGVHTDNLVHTHQDGSESVTTSRGDGLGLAMLKTKMDIPMLIISKERNPVVLKRAEKLGIEALHAVDDKVAALNVWLEERDLSWSSLLYVGNDVNDHPAMERAGLAACPSDALPDILAMADWVLPYPGGKGALRAMCDRLLEDLE